eukprot:jgi/Botrbrau1/11910/Bobra.0171s0020.1
MEGVGQHGKGHVIGLHPQLAPLPAPHELLLLLLLLLTRCRPPAAWKRQLPARCTCHWSNGVSNKSAIGSSTLGWGSTERSSFITASMVSFCCVLAARTSRIASKEQYNAHLASEEVRRLEGQLMGLEREHCLKSQPAEQRAVTQGMDIGGRVPWHPAGCLDIADASAIREKDQAEQRKNRRSLRPDDSWSGPCFLERLEHDLATRHFRLKDLEQRVRAQEHGPTPGRSKEGQNSIPSSLSAVGECIRTRTDIDTSGFGNIRETCSPDILTSSIAAAAAAIDDAVNRYQGEFGLSDRQADGLRSRSGKAKVEAFVRCVQSHMFMERYRQDLDSRNDRLKAVRDKWLRLQMYDTEPPKGRLALFHKPRKTVEQKEKEDLKTAGAHFSECGWPVSTDGEGWEAAEPLFNALLERAVRICEARSEEITRGVTSYNPNHDLDSLDQLQAAALKERDLLTRSERGTAKQEAKAGGQGYPHACGNLEPGQQASPTTGTQVPLQRTLELLGSCRKDELQKLLKLQGKLKVLGVYRALSTQRFVEFTKEDLRKREAKAEAALAKMQTPPRFISRSQQEGFFARLLADTERRMKSRECLTQQAKEAEIARLTGKPKQPQRAQSVPPRSAP